MLVIIGSSCLFIAVVTSSNIVDFIIAKNAVSYIFIVLRREFEVPLVMCEGNSALSDAIRIMVLNSRDI